MLDVNIQAGSHLGSTSPFGFAYGAAFDRETSDETGLYR
jgi:hypothetical protein